MSSPRPLTAPTGADLISSNPDRGSLRGGNPKGRSRKGMDLAGPEPPFSLLLPWLLVAALPRAGKARVVVDNKPSCATWSTAPMTLLKRNRATTPPGLPRVFPSTRYRKRRRCTHSHDFTYTSLPERHNHRVRRVDPGSAFAHYTAAMATHPVQAPRAERRGELRRRRL